MRIMNKFELVIDGEVCSVVLTMKTRGKHPVYNVEFGGVIIGEVTRVRPNCWRAVHREIARIFGGSVRQECVTSMITSIYGRK